MRGQVGMQIGTSHKWTLRTGGSVSCPGEGLASAGSLSRHSVLANPSPSQEPEEELGRWWTGGSQEGWRGSISTYYFNECAQKSASSEVSTQTHTLYLQLATYSHPLHVPLCSPTLPRTLWLQQELGLYFLWTLVQLLLLGGPWLQGPLPTPGPVLGTIPRP